MLAPFDLVVVACLRLLSLVRLLRLLASSYNLSTNVDVAKTTITYNNSNADGNGDRSASNNASGVDGIQDSGAEMTSFITKCAVASDDHKA